MPTSTSAFRYGMGQEQEPGEPLNQYREAFRESQRAEQEAAGVARQRQQDYNPQEYAERSARGMWDVISRDMSEQLIDLRGSQVGMGRLNTGFGYEDEDRLYRGAYDRMGSELASRSIQTAGLELGNINSMQQSRELAPSIAAGGIDQELALKDYERQRRGGLFGGIGGVLGGIAGFALGGGPVGAAVGSNIGGNLFRGLFS